MNMLWWIREAGIVFEFGGVILGVLFAWNTRTAWSFSEGTIIPEEIFDRYARARKEFQSQFGNQAIAFGLIGVGLVLQFVGNLANR